MMRKVIDWIVTIAGLGALAYGVIWFEKQGQSELIGRPSVVDGDSLVISGERIRLRGIDAPELDQQCEFKGRSWSCGRESRNYLAKLIARREVTCTAGTIDDYDRWLAQCRVNQIDLNKSLVLNGWAVSYGAYTAEEKLAKDKSAGIWRGSFERPRSWRDAQRGSAGGLQLRD